MKEESVARSKPSSLVLFSLGIFLTIAGCRLVLLKYFGTDLPQFDAWGIEGDGIYKPYFTGSLKLADFFAPCNEHRVALTRLLSLSLLILNGLWDNQLQAIVNALIYSATGVTLYLFVARNLISVSTNFIWGAAVAITFSLPYGWENAIWGFQSQFYLLVALSLAVICVTCLDGQLSAGRLGLLTILQLTSLFTMASGVLVSVAVLGINSIVIIRNWGNTTVRLRTSLHSITSFAVAVVGMLVVYVPVHGHNPMKATTLVGFLTVLCHCLSWPFFPYGFWWLVNWLPWGVLLFLYLQRKTEDAGVIRFAIALGIWVILQAAATAYARNSIALFSKYSDPLALGMLVNILSLIVLFGYFPGVMKKGLIAVALCWVTFNGYALYAISGNSVGSYLPEKREAFDIQIDRTRQFFLTGNMETLIPEGRHQIPEHDYKQYAGHLLDPVINKILPRSVNIKTGLPAARLSRGGDLLIDASWFILVTGLVVVFLYVLQNVVMFFRSRGSQAKGSSR